MGSKKMVLMIPYAGPRWRRKHREQTGGQWGRRGWDKLRSSPETCTLPCVKQIASGNLVYAAGTHTHHTSYIHHTSHAGALWQTRGVRWGGRWEGCSRGTGHMHTCGWLMLMHGRSQPNIVKEIIFQLKINKLKNMWYVSEGVSTRDKKQSRARMLGGWAWEWCDVWQVQRSPESWKGLSSALGRWWSEQTSRPEKRRESVLGQKPQQVTRPFLKPR